MSILIDTERFEVTVTPEHIRFGIQNDVFPLAIAIDQYFKGKVAVEVLTHCQQTKLSQGGMTYLLHHERAIRRWLENPVVPIVVDVDKRGGWIRQIREV